MTDEFDLNRAPACEGTSWPDKLIFFPELRRMVIFSWMTVLRLESAGLFPQRVRLSRSQIVWVRSEVIAWMQEKVDARPSDGSARMILEPGDRFIERNELVKVIPYSVNHFWKLESQGRFPKRIRLSSHRMGWLEREVLQWLWKKRPAWYDAASGSPLPTTRQLSPAKRV